MNYFIADTHFGHENIIKLCNRPFSSIEEMDNAIIEKWNSKIKNGDTIYILGDLFFKTASVIPVLERLKGHKHLILGNHDSTWTKQVELSQYFESVNLMFELNDGQRQITLCHYPMMTWKSPEKMYMIYGHIHNNTHDDYWPLIQKREKMLNAGVEINNYEPVTFEELLFNNAKFRAEHL